MNLTESEKSLAYQIELTDQIGTLHELAMMNRYTEYSCAMKSHFQKFGNQMSGSGNHLCKFTRVMFYPDHIPLAWICHAQHQCL